MSCVGFGILWLFSSVLSSLGALNQIRHNYQRNSVSGLSLFDTEIRLYGKLPWILFACALGTTDWWVLSANCIGILIAIMLLLQFNFYSEHAKSSRIFFGIAFTFFAFVFSLYNDLSSYQETAKFLPAFFSVLIVPLASRSQYLLNSKNSCAAVTPTRYILYLLSNFTGFAYGLSKMPVAGPENVWPLLLACAIGASANAILLYQVLREAESPIWNVTWLPSFSWATTKTPSG